MHKTYRSGLLIGFNMKDFNKILHQNSVASVSGLSILFSDIYLKLEAHFVIQAQLVFNQVYFFFNFYSYIYVKHCPAVVATLHIPSIQKKNPEIL